MEIYRKSAKGRQVLKDRSVALPPRQRMAFVLFDGEKSLAQIGELTRGIGVTSADIEALIRLGLIELVEVQSVASSITTTSSYTEIGSLGDILTPTGAVTNAPSTVVPESEHQTRYATAYPIAVAITSSLGLRGFKLNLAVESAMGYKDLVALLPRIIELAGREKCHDLVGILLR